MCVVGTEADLVTDCGLVLLPTKSGHDGSTLSEPGHCHRKYRIGHRMPRSRQGIRKWRWADAEKRSISFQTAKPDVSVAQVALRHAVSASLMFKWRIDPRHAPNRMPWPGSSEAPCVVPVEIVEAATTDHRIEIEFG